jgi:hypothetical protein
MNLEYEAAGYAGYDIASSKNVSPANKITGWGGANLVLLPQEAKDARITQRYYTSPGC